jgi:hypothetical protein
VDGGAYGLFVEACAKEQLVISPVHFDLQRVVALGFAQAEEGAKTD